MGPDLSTTAFGLRPVPRGEELLSALTLSVAGVALAGLAVLGDDELGELFD